MGFLQEVFNSRSGEIGRLLSTSDRTWIDYPWYELKGELASTDANSFRMIGYGSLLDSLSAKSHIASGARNRVLTFGLRRLFNYQMPDAFRRAWQINAGSNRTAALNVEVTHMATDTANGVLVHVAANEIDGMLEREQGYDLISVPFLPWSDPAADVEFAYVLSARRNSSSGAQFIRDDILPAVGYLDLCCRGARSGGQVFLANFLSSTYLADGVTPLKSYLDRQQLMPKR